MRGGPNERFLTGGEALIEAVDQGQSGAGRTDDAWAFRADLYEDQDATERTGGVGEALIGGE
jgi:hypothetical protein